MSEGILELTEADFDQTIQSGVTVVDFWAPWCGPCKTQVPILEGMVDKTGDAKIAKVNVDDAPALAARFGVRSIPTILIMKDGEVKQQFVGVQQESALLEAIESA